MTTDETDDRSAQLGRALGGVAVMGDPPTVDGRPVQLFVGVHVLGVVKRNDAVSPFSCRGVVQNGGRYDNEYEDEDRCPQMVPLETVSVEVT